MNRVVPSFKSINKKVIDNALNERKELGNSNNSTSLKEKIVIKVMSRRDERNFSDLIRKY